MKNLKEVLIGITQRDYKAGGVVSRQTKLALRAHRKKKLAIAASLVVFIVGCLALSVYLLVQNGSHQGRDVAALAGIGGTGGALEALRRVWKDYSQTDLLLILVEDANEANVTALINRLIKSL
jgi:hypothetical protein